MSEYNTETQDTKLNRFISVMEVLQVCHSMQYLAIHAAPVLQYQLEEVRAVLLLGVGTLTYHDICD
jgi:hypothetical protein